MSLSPDNSILERLSSALQIRTVSQSGTPPDHRAFLELHEFLRRSFPNVHSHLTQETVNTYSLLYTWRGRNPDLDPIVFLAHLDVVPVEPETEHDWAHPPFSGAIADGYVWGRGALDLKSSVLAMLEAAESLIAEGFEPSRTIHFAFGHDEEIGGTQGAKAIAELLQSRGVHPACVLDEGSFVIDGLMSGIDDPVAFIGVAEKGYANIELLAHAPGGHASMPERESAVGILAHAIAKIERNPFPARIHPIAAAMLDQLASRLPWMQRLLLRNRWLTRPIVLRALSKSPGMNAELRTTLAPTVFQGSVKENVLAQQARAIVNARILPGDSVSSVLSHIESVIADRRVQLTALVPAQEPSESSPITGPRYDWIANAVREAYPDVVIAPYVTVATTDARYYSPWVDAVYRILPVRLPMEDIGSIHGTNERIGVPAYFTLIGVIRRLMQTA